MSHTSAEYIALAHQELEWASQATPDDWRSADFHLSKAQVYATLATIAPPTTQPPSSESGMEE